MLLIVFLRAKRRAIAIAAIAVLARPFAFGERVEALAAVLVAPLAGRIRLVHGRL